MWHLDMKCVATKLDEFVNSFFFNCMSIFKDNFIVKCYGRAASHMPYGTICIIHYHFVIPRK